MTLLELTSFRLDSTYNYFKKGIDSVRVKLEKRFYTTVASFTFDLGQAFNFIVYSPDAEPIGIPGGEVNAPMHKLKATEKEKKTRAKRILKSIQSDLLKAAENEADLEGKSHEEATRVVQDILDNALQPPSDVQGSVSDGIKEAEGEGGANGSKETNDASGTAEDVEMVDIDDAASLALSAPAIPIINGHGSHEAATGAEDVALSADQQEAMNMRATPGLPALSNSGSTNPSTTCHDPLTPPHGDKDIIPVVTSGGVPWYLESFEPDGTTIYDERWSGREAMRGISEELSELDDDAVNGLLESENGKADEEPPVAQGKLKVPVATPKKKSRAKKRNNW
jgi:NuA3 HAT complex component NTO1